MNVSPVAITDQQFEEIRCYLDDDCQMHLAAHGKWHLDKGKLLTALEKADIAVKRPQTILPSSCD